MPDPTSWQLPIPKDHQAFERLCRDLVAAREGPSATTALLGRNGQHQHGADLVVERSDGVHLYQCKCVVRLTRKAVEKEIAKAVGAFPKVRSFTVLTTASPDAKLQVEMLALAQERRSNGQFPVRVENWDEIQTWLGKYPEVLRAHYPNLAPTLHPPRSARYYRVGRMDRALELAGLLDRVGAGCEILERTAFSIFSVPTTWDPDAAEGDRGYWRALMHQRMAMEAALERGASLSLLLTLERDDLDGGFRRARAKTMADWLSQPHERVRVALGEPRRYDGPTGAGQNTLVVPGHFAVLGERDTARGTGFRAEVNLHEGESGMVASVAAEILQQFDSWHCALRDGSTDWDRVRRSFLEREAATLNPTREG